MAQVFSKSEIRTWFNAFSESKKVQLCKERFGHKNPKLLSDKDVLSIYFNSKK